MGPIHDAMATVEHAGAIIHRWPFGTRCLDAISQVVPGCPPLIFVNADAPPDRQRFTLMHEVGHIFMPQIPSDSMEAEADRFAAAFLMPESEIRKSLRNLSMAKLPTLKAIWKVSMAALVKRAADLGEITPRQYRTYFVKFSKMGWRTNEPVELPQARNTGLQSIMRVQLDAHARELTAPVRATPAIDIEAARRSILSEVINFVRAAPQAVPLETLADRAVRFIGH